MRKKSGSLRSGYTASMLQGGNPFGWRGRKSQCRWIQANFKLNHSKPDVSSAAIHLTGVVLFFCESVVKPRVRGSVRYEPCVKENQFGPNEVDLQIDGYLSLVIKRNSHGTGNRNEQPTRWMDDWTIRWLDGDINTGRWMAESINGWTMLRLKYYIITCSEQWLLDQSRIRQNRTISNAEKQCWKILSYSLRPEWERSTWYSALSTLYCCFWCSDLGWLALWVKLVLDLGASGEDLLSESRSRCLAAARGSDDLG